jgi:hypothetical protein
VIWAGTLDLLFSEFAIGRAPLTGPEMIAIPMTFALIILAIWPAIEPTAPEAAETTKVCPDFGGLI